MKQEIHRNEGPQAVSNIFLNVFFCLDIPSRVPPIFSGGNVGILKLNPLTRSGAVRCLYVVSMIPSLKST